MNKREHQMMTLTIAAISFAAIGVFIRIAARHWTGFADGYRWVVTPVMMQTVGRLCAALPFSVVEILIIGLILLGIVSLTASILRLLKNRWLHFKCRLCLLRLLMLISLIFLLYEAGEDVYFYCTPFSEIYGIGEGSYTTAELAEVCRTLAARCNEVSPLVRRDQNGIMENNSRLPHRAAMQMTKLGRNYPLLFGYYPPPKGLLASILMSKTNMTGIYSAYTIEANYNTLMPDYNTAFTLCHELSHLQGVLPENEANFIAYLACRNAADPDIAYSGAMLGWVYCGNELYRRDKELWREIESTLNDSVNLDLSDNNAYWAQFNGKAAKAAEKFNDAYLKQAGQSDGVESYHRVVDFIVSFENAGH